MRPSTLAVLAVLVACSRRQEAPTRPAARPQVTPERTAPDASTRAPTAPPAGRITPEGPCVPETPGGVALTELSGRIDRLRIAAAGDRARLVAELTVRRTSATKSVDFTVQGEGTPAETLTVGAARARVVAAPVAVAGRLETVMFGTRRTDLDGQDFSRAFAWVLGARRSTTQHSDVDEVVAASAGSSWIAAAAGTRVDCFGDVCETAMRAIQGATWSPKAGYEVLVATPVGDAIAQTTAASVGCEVVDPLAHAETFDPERAGDEGFGEGPAMSPFMLAADQRGEPLPDRCVQARRTRPYDVAIAADGARVVVAWRRPRAVEILRGTASHLTDPPWVFEGDVGAPAVTLRGNETVAVWAQRDDPRGPYTLRMVSWREGDTARPAPRVLVTGTVSAFAPALTTRGGQLVLAWMEGDDRSAAVRAGVTAIEPEHLVDHIVTLSHPDTNARDPELASSADHTWAAWSEYAGGRRRDQSEGVVRVTVLRLP